MSYHLLILLCLLCRYILQKYTILLLRHTTINDQYFKINYTYRIYHARLNY